MNVSLAVQIMSKTSMPLQYLRSGASQEQRLGKKLADSWFDLFTSRRLKDIKLSRYAHGLHLMEQTKY